MNERRLTLAGRRSNLSLRVCTVLLLGSLVAIPLSVAARPVVEADFLQFNGLKFAKHVHSPAKLHVKAHGKTKKKPQRHAPRRNRRHAPAHGWTFAGGSLVHDYAMTPWWWPVGGVVSSAGIEYVNVPLDLGDSSDDSGISGDVNDEPTQDESSDDEMPAPDLGPVPFEFVSEFVPDDDEEIISDGGANSPVSLLDAPINDALPPPLRLPSRAPVPEPSSLALAGLAALAAWRLARRQQGASGEV